MGKENVLTEKHLDFSKVRPWERPAIEAASLLLGWILVRKTPKGTIKLKIVETEAYHQDDPASHSFRGQTKRTAPMFKEGGCLYIYFTYGMHYCMNIVVGQKGVGEAVLIRAGEPLEGIGIIQKNRGGISDIYQLANGPGKLAQALGINDTSLSGKKLNPSTTLRASKPGKYADIWLEPPEKQIQASEIVASPRIGIRKGTEAYWRFYLKNSPFISKHRYNKTDG